MGKKLVAARELPAGHVLGSDDIAIKSPADGGLPPYELDNLVGRRLTRPLEPDEAVVLDALGPIAEPAAVAKSA
jgi:N-acetylneuraminate synthase/sialic acid synthase